MKIAGYACDYCAAAKGDANHWWLIWRGVNPAEVPSAFHLIPWDDTKATTFDHEHVCGQACAAKALAKWMSAQSANAGKPQPVETVEKSTDAK